MTHYLFCLFCREPIPHLAFRCPACGMSALRPIARPVRVREEEDRVTFELDGSEQPTGEAPTNHGGETV